jgi:hypothetical protein
VIVPAFDRASLLPADPVWIVDLNPMPVEFSVFLDYDLDHDEGWLYAEHFHSTDWSELYNQTFYVRRRKVFRLLMSNDDLELGQALKDSWLARSRTIHPRFISSALKGYEHKIEMVIEYQRFLRDRYDSYNLIYSDPAHWNFALPAPPPASGFDSLFDETNDFNFVDPTSCPLSYLRPLDQCTSFKLIDGWQILHDFIHLLHPNKDEAGWQYSDIFLNDCERTNAPTSASSHWSNSRGFPPRSVRRRLWMRTLVKDCDLEDCRAALDDSIAAHPRGVIFSSRLQRRSCYRKRWCDAVATLKDSVIEIEIENNYQRFVSYPLQGCEPVLLSHLTGEGDLINKFFLFGLRRIGGGLLPGLPVENNLDSTGGVFCILNAPSAEVRDCWISVLTHQLLLVNTHRFLRQSCPQWSPLIGPPCLVDVPYITGRLWKRGDVVWKLRTFELRKSGILAYFKRGRLIGEVKLLNECAIRIPPDINFQFPFQIITSDGTIVLELAAPDAVARQKWMTALRWNISAAWERKISICSAVAGGKKEEEVGVFWYDGETDRFEPSSVSTTESSVLLRDLPADNQAEEPRARKQEQGGVSYGSPHWMLMMVGLNSEVGRVSADNLGNIRELHPIPLDLLSSFKDCHSNSSDDYSHWTANYDEEDDEEEEIPTTTPCDL